MKYDKMVECSLERSKQKVETAKREIQEMLESKEKITVAALIQKTGFSKGFFYRNEEMRRVVNEAMHQQSVTYNPKQIIIDMAMERTLVNAKTTIQELKLKIKKLEKENAEMQKKIPSTMDRLLEKKNLELLETRNFNLRQENKELKEALEEERSFSDRLLEGIDRVLDMLERHLPKQLLHLVDKARDLLPEHQTYRQEKQHERGHSWGDMSL